MIVSNSALGQLALDGHALHDPGAVAQDGEGDLARLPQVVEPPGNDDGFAGMLAGLLDGDPARGGGWVHLQALQFLEDPADVFQRLRHSSGSPAARAAAGTDPARERSSSMVCFQSMVPAAIGEREQVDVAASVVVVDVRRADPVAS